MVTAHPATLQAEIAQLLQEHLRAPTSIPPTPDSSAAVPSNLLETWAFYFLQLSLPGIEPATVKIEVVGRQVAVTGKYHLPAIETATSVWHDLAAGGCEAIVRMPAEVDGDKAEAQYERGILTIKLPKAAFLKPSSIPVRVVQ